MPTAPSITLTDLGLDWPDGSVALRGISPSTSTRPRGIDARERGWWARGMAFTITRVLDADRATVFRAWTDPERLRWFFSGREPAGEPVEVDLRVGGSWRQRMVVDAQTDYVTGGIYRRIEPNTLLEFRWGAEDGWPALNVARPDSGPLVTVTLDDGGSLKDAGQTRMTIVVDPPDDVPAEVCVAGWNETIDRLVDAVAD